MRNVYIVDAAQVVVSDANPQGVYGALPDYPKKFDSRNYPAADGNPNGDEEAALDAAKSAYHVQLSKLYVGSPSRVMWTVTLTRADGRQIMRESRGAFPDMTPEPQPEPQPEPEGEATT